MNEDVGQVKAGWIHPPSFEIEPIGERGHGTIKLHDTIQEDTVFIQAHVPAKGTCEKILQKCVAQYIRIFTDEEFVVPKEITFHSRKEYEQDDGEVSENKDDCQSCGFLHLTQPFSFLNAVFSVVATFGPTHSANCVWVAFFIPYIPLNSLRSKAFLLGPIP